MRGPREPLVTPVMAVPRRRNSWVGDYGQRRAGGRLPSCWSAHAGAAARRRPHPPRRRPRRAQPRRRGRVGRAGRVRRAAPSAAPVQPSRRSRPATRSLTGIDQGRRRQLPFTRQDGFDPDPVDRRRGHELRAAVADFATATGIEVQVDSIGSSHETVLKTRIEGGRPPDMASSRSRPPSSRTRSRARSSTSRRSWTPRSSAESIPPPSAWSPRATTSGASPTRPTSSRPSGTRSRPSRPRATRSPRPGTS